jgi:hypothetical protein
MAAIPVTAVVGQPRARRWRSWHWVALGLVAVAAVAAFGAYLTAPRSGGRMDPADTGPDGAHALVTLLRDHGVEVVVAATVADAEHAARPDALVLVAETQRIAGDGLLQRLARLPGDRLLIQPTAHARKALAPGIRTASLAAFSRKPGCDLREVDRAGPVDLQATQTYVATDDQPINSCYDGTLVRYRTDNRSITVVGGASFMTNSGLLSEGNAALAMNLAGTRPRLVWYAPQHIEGQTSATATIFDLIPKNVSWMVLQLCLVVALLALWKGRRIGPLVAEELPVVVRASETVEGRGRLYRSRRASDRAAQALRGATLQRLSPRLGLGVAAPAPAVVTAVAQRSDAPPEWVWHLLFGPPPGSDDDLLHLARALDDIERQVIGS